MTKEASPLRCTKSFAGVLFLQYLPIPYPQLPTQIELSMVKTPKQMTLELPRKQLNGRLC